MHGKDKETRSITLQPSTPYDNYRLVMTKDVSTLVTGTNAYDVYYLPMFHTYCQYTTTSIPLIKSHTDTSHIK